MLHETNKERQVLGFHPLLIEGENMLAAAGAQQEVGILDPFGDALERSRLPDIVTRQKGAQRIVRDFGVDSHVPPVEAAHRMRAMADPLSGVYKTGQSPSFVASRRSSGRVTAASDTAPERGLSGL